MMTSSGGLCGPGIDIKSVEVSLQGKPNGTFLVRGSSASIKDNFVLSVSENAKVNHYIIQRTGASAFAVMDKSFADIPSVRLHQRFSHTHKTFVLQSYSLVHPNLHGTGFGHDFYLN
jgi:hypothetical protein